MTGPVLEDWLAHMGWSRQEFARRIKVHPNTISQWVKGHREISGAAEAYLLLAAKVKGLLD